jgi:hypothetical protein
LGLNVAEHMSEGAIGLIVLVSLSVVAAVVSHMLVRRYLLAAACGALVADILFQVAAFVHLGHLDPFILIAFVVAGGLAFGIALVVGLPFRFMRRRAQQ